MVKISAIAEYFAKQIVQGKIKYSEVEETYPGYINDIDLYLKDQDLLDQYKDDGKTYIGVVN